MDEYAGSVFEPVSLHKYLYANANPVMFNDPSGYSAVATLPEQTAVIGIMGVLAASVIVPCFAWFAESMALWLTDICDYCVIKSNDVVKWAEGLLDGSETSASIGDKTSDENTPDVVDEDDKQNQTDGNQLYGPPGQTLPRSNKDGEIIGDRTYGPDGRADVDTDYTDHGNPKQHPEVPHKHKWDWTNPTAPKRLPWGF